MRLLALGSNGAGQLGLGHCRDVDSCQQAFLPLSLAGSDVTVSQIACSSNATALLLSSGQLLITGQIAGLSFTEFTPFPIPSSSVAMIFCGWDHLCWISQSDCRLVHVLGSFSAANVDIPVESFDIQFPELEQKCRVSTYQLPFPITVNSIRSGPRHFLFTSESRPDSVYGIGDNRNSQISFKDQCKTIGFSGPLSIALSMDDAEEQVIDYCASMKHSCFLTSNGNVFITRKLCAPICINLRSQYLSISMLDCRIASSWSCVYVLIGKRQLFATNFKDSDYGFQKLHDFPHDVDISIGSEHYLIYKSGGNTVSAVGWNEHGNCGISEEQMVADPQLIFKEDGEGIRLIKAGYATSFIIMR